MTVPTVDGIVDLKIPAGGWCPTWDSVGEREKVLLLKKNNMSGNQLVRVQMRYQNGYLCDLGEGRRKTLK